jgi:hypothetical protein
MFQSISNDEGLELTYRIFNSKALRESLSISTEKWKGLEPVIRENINEIRTKIMQQWLSSQPKMDKIPDQYFP